MIGRCVRKCDGMTVMSLSIVGDVVRTMLWAVVDSLGELVGEMVVGNDVILDTCNGVGITLLMYSVFAWYSVGVMDIIWSVSFDAMCVSVFGWEVIRENGVNGCFDDVLLDEVFFNVDFFGSATMLMCKKRS